jgi:hypothetical protein
LPRAYGTDLVTPAAGGALALTCASSKGWRPRTPRTRTSVEHPGSAVEWEGEIFEVLDAVPLADGRTRYRLAAWDSRHAIRTLDRYDADAETSRAVERSERVRDLRSRRTSVLLAPLVGHLPAHVQEEMEKQFGARAVGLTIASAFPLFVLGFLSAFNQLTASVGSGLSAAGGPQRLTVFPWLAWLPAPAGMFLLLESTLRLASAFVASRPCGSLLGVLAYEAWLAAGGKRYGRPLAVRVEAPPDPVRDAGDRYHLLEPIAALLRPDEQKILAERFRFDPVRWGRRTAAWLAAFAALNVLVSLVQMAAGRGGTGDFLWLLAGIALLFEQLARRRVLARGLPAGSVLGAVVRPLAREMLRERR